MRRDPSLIPLSHQHHNGLALCVLTRRSLAAGSSPGDLSKAARRIVDRYQLELVNHFEIEEQVLFPVCGNHPLIPSLIEDHRMLEKLAGELATAPSAAAIERFCDLLSTHIRREEKELFEQIQTDLPREVLDRVAGEIDRGAVRICL